MAMALRARSRIGQGQVLSYRKLSGKSVGLLINFNVVHWKKGIKPFVDGTDWRRLSPLCSLWLRRGSYGYRSNTQD